MRKGKYERRYTPVFNFAMCMALVLFWLVMITTHVSVELFAKYTTTGSGDDSARVLTFKELKVSENDVEGATGKTFIFIPGVDLEKKINVSFAGSEADVFVFVALDTPGWTQSENYQFSLKDGNNNVLMSWAVEESWTYLSSNGNQHVYYSTLDANNAFSHDVIKDGKIVVNVATRAAYNALRGSELNLNATAYVVQAGGFENATAAWNSLNK